MNKFVYALFLMISLLFFNTLFAANYILGYSSVDDGEIRWGGSTLYASQLTGAINTWNTMRKVLIAPDNIYTYEDLHVSDTYLNGVGWYGMWTRSSGTDNLQLNTAQMKFLIDSRKQGVILHELGHSLGLDHHDMWENVMYFQTVSRTSLGSQDMADYRYIYGY